MVVVNNVVLTELGALMPAAMLPCPSPAGSDWSFQNPVGVDCSSPEPRCIWLAVLHRTRSPTPVTVPTSHNQNSCQLRAKGQRDGHSSAGDNPRPPIATRPGREGVGVGWKGPWTLVLHKNSQGFGFTLRHFIVYPPESALHTNLKDEENGNGKGFQKVRLEPMDTIFVKNVREKGPAHKAGLCTGDRLVKVNGESVLGKTYSQVITLIQNSESVLELSIMPKDEDVLQLAYSQNAYLTGNEGFAGGAKNLPQPPPFCYPRTRTAPHPGAPLCSPMGQNHLDSRSCWPGFSSPSSPLDNRPGVASPASWQEGQAGEPGEVGQSSPARHTEESQYVMTSQQPQGQTRRCSYSSSFSSGGLLFSPLQVHHPNHQSGGSSQAQPCKSSSTWTSPAMPPVRHRCNERCHQALFDWYYSQLPEHSGRSMQTRHRSYSQDRLSEYRRQKQRAGDWPHSASKDTLFLLQQSGQGPQGEPYWSTGDWEAGHNRGRSDYTRTRSENLLAQYNCHGRSLEMLDRASAELVSPRSERQPWPQQASQPPRRTDAYPRTRCHTIVASTPVPRPSQSKHHPQTNNQAHSQPHQRPTLQSRWLPAGQSMDEQQVGYRSYSPSFYRKTSRILQQAHSFRDPSYSGPHLNWNPVPKSGPPEGSSAPLFASASTALTSVSPESQDRVYRSTNHEREQGAVDEPAEMAAQTQEVVLRQKPPTGRRNVNRHPHYGITMDELEPALFTPDPKDTNAHPGSVEELAPRKANGNLAPLSLEDDSLASIPFIDEPTSPGADLRARHVPASSVVSSGMSSAPPAGTSPASPTFTFPPTRLFSHNCTITTERSKSCDEGLNTFREERSLRQPKRVKSFFGDGLLDTIGTVEEVRSKRHSTSELGNITYSDIRREGWLQFKQILTEKGKKVGSGLRPWKRVYSILRSHSLFLYKDKREAVLRGASIGGAAEDELPINIRGCLVDIAYSETKRKHALRLTTQDFCEYLLQAEDREDMLNWIKVIRESNKTDNEELGFSRQALISKKLNDYRKQSPTSSKPDSSPRMQRMMSPFLLNKTENTAGAPRSPKQDGKDESSPPKSPWGINIMKKSKKAGPKAFGVRLEECQPGTNNKFIPMIVEFCCGLVEEMGLEYTGIYRVPGNNAIVLQLQEQLNKGMDINPAEEKWQDLNVVSSLLKSFFRKLPEPLFTNDKYNDFINANRMENASERLKTMKKMIRDLPDHYYHTLKFLISHLKTVADHSDKNKMEPRNLALVFGPTLVRTSEDNMKDMVTHMPDRYKIVETLIQHCIWFFTDELDKDEKTPVDTEDVQPAPNIDHLLSNIGRTALLGEASDSTNSDSAKSKGSWGSKKDLTAKDFLALSIMSAVTGRKRRKRHLARRVGSSTDDDSEHEPFKAGHIGMEEEEQAGNPVAETALRAEGEEEEDDDDEEVVEGGGKEEAEEEVVVVVSSRPCFKEEEGGGRQTAILLQEEAVQPEVKGQPWRAPDDAHSIVSGYSTLSTLGRSLGSEGRGDDADDEPSELVSETDNESGFASRSLTQERPSKHSTTPANPQPPTPRSFLYSQCKPPVLSPANLLQATPITHTTDSAERNEEGARSNTPSSSSSSTAHRLHSRPSFNSHKLIQCDTLARKKLKSEKTKACSLDLLESQGEGTGSVSESAPRPRRDTSKINPSSGSSQESLRQSRSRSALPPNEAASFTPTAPGGRSLAEHVRARLLGSADDLRSVGLRKPPSPETRRKKRAWRRHTVVASPTKTSEKRPPLTVNEFPLSPMNQNQVKTQGLTQGADNLDQEPVTCQVPTSRFHQYL
ncbi:rho GTPase-activating protein 23-like isoform X2 [Girardinichthys multiradiatus]|uniref:rho GTPase-activating protein 23-like isoform X2 n=1 Tax=Girardinichthys multiradiatus TaxID=208333 RepID=UPI001FAE553C|nr:rho GTPase-activating protein 23-like isoform X2 [Girardinichthys multiradiatus]